jgi:drug/metabolite transporter (DMT)-like permease
MSVLLWALEPLLILALAFWILKDRVSVPFAVCAATALAGAVLVVFQPGSEATAAGVALTIAGVAACAVYTVLSSRFLIAASSLSVVFVQQVAAFVFSLVLLGGSVVVADPRSIWGVSGTAWLSALGAGILYYAVAFWFYVTGLRGVRPAFAGMFLNLIPMFGLAASYLFLDERLTGRQWFGAALILAAVVTITGLQTPAPQRQSHEAVL